MYPYLYFNVFLLVLSNILIVGDVQCLSLKKTEMFNTRFNFFDIDLLHYLAEENTGNLMVSPASVKSILGLLLEGSGGDTADEIRKALRLPLYKDDYRRQFFNYLNSLQANHPGIILKNTNGLFISHRLKVKKEYETLLRTTYNAKVVSVDFSKPELVAHDVNTWVNTHTNGLIPILVESRNIEPNSLVVLTNAVYFKSAWEKSFDANQTSLQCFYTIAGCTKVQMMATQGDYNYAQIGELKAQAVELLYQGGKHSMVVLMPNENNDVYTLIRDLPYVSLPHILDQMEFTEVQLSLPRFSVDFTEDLVPILKNIRINKIFTNHANLSGIIEGTNELLINQIFQKTHIDVTETGTIAAAATGSLVVPLMESSTARFNINHPFIFFIRDVHTGAVLFEGKIEVPQATVPQKEEAKTKLADAEASTVKGTEKTVSNHVTVRTLTPAIDCKCLTNNIHDKTHLPSGRTYKNNKSLNRSPKSRVPYGVNHLKVKSTNLYQASPLLLSKINSDAIVMDLGEFFNDQFLVGNQLSIKDDDESDNLQGLLMASEAASRTLPSRLQQPLDGDAIVFAS